MKHFSRISTVWRKEFADTLRDRRTLIAMVLVPMVLYPALMLGSLQAFEVQVGRLRQEEVTVAAAAPQVKEWLEKLLAEDVQQRRAERAALLLEPGLEQMDAEQRAQQGAYFQPPPMQIRIFENVSEAVQYEAAEVAVLAEPLPLPSPADEASTGILIVVNSTNVRGLIGRAALEGLFARTTQRWARERLARIGASEDLILPIRARTQDLATPEQRGGSVLGQIVALILVIMTITGAIYPAIDLTAGERERGTLETLMAAPVPTVDLIAGKFVVVASIGMLSAVLNLLSIGGTIYLAGFGDMLSQGQAVKIPLHTLPLVLVVLIPLAVMFSAMLLAVCSFARSFKEAQNYVMPVMMLALIPAVVGILPGTELSGPLLIMPVTNIVILTRDLFMGQINQAAILWVTLSTCFYAGAAVAVAAKLFGQEAVLFADSSSVRTLFMRKFFPPRRYPSAAQAFLLIALVYSLNFFLQRATLDLGLRPGTREHLASLALTLVFLFAVLPIAVTVWARVDVTSAFALHAPRPGGWAAALLIGGSSWVLAIAWLSVQERILPLPPDLIEAFRPLEEQLATLPVLTAVLFMALVPALCEELFFRGYALSGLRGVLGKAGAVVLVAVAFGAAHYSVHRLMFTTFLGLLLGVLVVQWRSIWPAVLAHALHNSLIVLVPRADGLRPWLERIRFLQPDQAGSSGLPPWPWITGAGLCIALAVVLSLLARPRLGAPGEADTPGTVFSDNSAEVRVAHHKGL